jgi:predicted Zn-dependent protease
VAACESGVLGAEGRWEDALRSAESAWTLDEGAPAASMAVGASLMNLGRFEECASRLAAAAERSQSYDLVADACWRQCAYAETLEGPGRDAVIDTARRLADRLDTLAPLADREWRRAIARVRLDIADVSDDYAGIERWAGEVRAPFFRHVLANLRKNPDGRRIRLPFQRTTQKYDTCVPASLSAAMSAGGILMSADEMASAVTFGGTSDWAAADWLRSRGFHVRFFAVTGEVAARLIEHGIGFVLSWDAEEHGHSVAIVGFDQRAETLLVHDPGVPRDTEYLLDGLHQNAGPFGVRGVAVVGQEQAAVLDSLLPAESLVVELAVAHHRAVQTQGPSPARAIATDMAERFPAHPGTRFVTAFQALHDGHVGHALKGLQELLAQFPLAPWVRGGVVSACRALGNTALLQSVLQDVVERGVLPGLQAEQEWVRPPDRYVCEYADLLRLSSATRDRAEQLLRRLLRRQPGSAAGWHILADLLWHRRDTEGLLLCHRFAAGLAPADEHYAQAFADALIAQRQAEEALAFLESRVRARGDSPHAVGTWITWVGVLEDNGRPERALDACRQALDAHPHSPQLLGFAVALFARMGLWEQAQEQLERLESAGHPAAHHEAAAYYWQMRGEWNPAVEHAEAWVREVPHAWDARRRLLDAVSARDGAGAAIARAAAWLKENPGHEVLEEIYCVQLDRTPGLRWKRCTILRRRVKRNRDDGWAWTNLAFEYLQHYIESSEPRRARLRGRVMAFLAECHRVAADAVPTLRLDASWAEAEGHWVEAVRGWMTCVDRDPSSFFHYRRAWDCSARLSPEERRAAWEEMSARLLNFSGRLSCARDLMALLVERLGPRDAEKEIERWRAERPDDPDVVEAAADLLIEHGHGRSDAGRALAALEPAVRRHPYHAGLRFSLAMALRGLERHDEAEEALLEIVRRHPGNAAAYIQLAWTKESQGDCAAACEFLDQALSRAPQHPGIFDARAQILFVHGKTDEARTWIERGLQRFPEDVLWRERAIAILNQCRAFDAAAAAAREGVAIAPRDANAWLLLGRTLNEMHRYARVGEIGECYRRSLALNPSLTNAAFGLADWLVTTREDYDEAVRVASDAESRMTDPCVARAERAWIRHRRGEKAAAVSDLTDVVRASPWYAWGWLTLAEWIEEDRNWGLAHLVFGDLPPQMLTNTAFRQRRLVLLQRAGLGQEALDREWDELIRDFPEDPSIPAARERANEPVAAGEPEAAPSPMPSEVPWWAWMGLVMVISQFLRNCL